MPVPCIVVHSADGTKAQIQQGSQVPVADRQNTLAVVTTVSAAGITALVAAPGAPYRIVVSSFTMQNESSTATTMQLVENGGGAFERILGQNQGDGLARAYAIGHEWRLPLNTGLDAWLSGANQCGFTVHYWVEAL